MLNVGNPSRLKNRRSSCCFSRAQFLRHTRVEATKPNKPVMKRIEAVVKRSSLDDFHRCAKQLGIFGFDLCENPTKRRDHQRLAAAGGAPDATSRLKVDFAVLDEETKPIVHAVLESVHPESIAIFKFDQDTQPLGLTRPAPSRFAR